jgi:AraC-like DNA-binding protein
VDRRVQIVLNEIDAQFGQEVRISDLARRAGVSPAGLERLFKTDVGLSIGEYLIEKRLSFAADLLSHSNEPVKEVMFQSGFKDPSNFNRAFRKRFGISPTRFRAGLSERSPK